MKAKTISRRDFVKTLGLGVTALPALKSQDLFANALGMIGSFAEEFPVGDFGPGKRGR